MVAVPAGHRRPGRRGGACPRPRGRVQQAGPGPPVGRAGDLPGRRPAPRGDRVGPPLPCDDAVRDRPSPPRARCGGVRAVTRRLAVPLAFVAVASSVVAVVALSGLLSPAPPDSAPAGAFWLTVLWASWAASLAWALTRRSFSMLFTAVLMAMFLFVLLPATGAEAFGRTTIAGNDYQGGVDLALQIAALAQAGMLLGAIAARTLWPFPPMRRLPVTLSGPRLDRAARRALVTGIAAVAAMIVLGHASPRDFFAYTSPGGYGTFYRELTGNLAFLSVAQCVAGLAIVLLPLRLGRATPARIARPLLVAALAAAGLLWLKTSARPLPPRRLAAAGMLAVVGAAALIAVARGAAGSRDVTPGAVLAQPFGSGNDLFLPLAGLAGTVPDGTPYLHGASYLQTVIFPIPRALWSGKPQDAISVVTGQMDPGNSGIAFPEFGEMYANFGLPGALIGSVLFGALTELLALRLAGSASLRESVLVAVGGSVLLDIFTRGAIAAMLTSFAGLLAVTALACRRRSALLEDVPRPVPVPPPRPGNVRWPAATA